MTLVHGWLLLAWMGCTSVPIEPSPDGQEASSRGDLDVSVGVLSLQRSALEEFAGDVFSNTAPVTLPGMAGWPVVVQLGQTRVRFDPSADKGDGRIQGIAHLETLATLVIPPFFQADDFPLHLSMPLSFDMKPGERTCMELRADLDGPILLDMSHFGGDLGAVAQGLLESVITQQVNQILDAPLWAPHVPAGLCPALSPVQLLSHANSFSASLGGPYDPSDASLPSVPTGMSWALTMEETSFGLLLNSIGSTDTLPSPWSVTEATSHIEGESWVVEARINPKRRPDRWRRLRGHYLWSLTEAEFSVTQDALIQTDAHSPPLWPSVAAIRARLGFWTGLMAKPRSVDTKVWGLPLRASVEELNWQPDQLTVLGRIEHLNSTPP